MRKTILLSLLLLLLPLSSFAQSVTMTWTDMSSGTGQEDNFVIERRVGQTGAFVDITHPAQNAQSFIDTTVLTGNEYCYRISAVNTAGKSAFSNTVCKTLTTAAPDAVLNLTSATVPETTPTGLVLALSFNEGPGTAVKDTSGKANNGVIAGAAWTTEGKYGNALVFDGVNNMVTVPDSASLDLTTAMTLSAWVFPISVTDWRTVMLKERAGDLVFSLYASDGGNLPSAIIYVGTTKQYLDSPAALPLNTWSYMSATYDGAQYRLYVDGTQVMSRAQTGKIVTSTGVLRIGGNKIWNEFFNGKIDEVKIYSRALTPAEILTDMNTP